MNTSRLVVGATGTIGRALLDRFRASGAQTLGTTRQGGRTESDVSLTRLDLRGPVDPWPADHSGGVAVLCAGVTSQAACEQDPEATHRINVVATLDLASRLVEEHGANVIYLSSNLVFDGAAETTLADATRAPRTEYGRQKAEVEERLQLLKRVAIVRLTKVFHPELPLLRSWHRALLSGQSISAYANQVIAPLRLDVVVDAIVTIADGLHTGIWQLSGPEDTSYLAFAQQFAEQLGCPPERVTSARAEAEHLPAHTVLDTRRARSELGLRFDPVSSVIEHLIRQIPAT